MSTLFLAGKWAPGSPIRGPQSASCSSSEPTARLLRLIVEINLPHPRHLQTAASGAFISAAVVVWVIRVVGDVQ